MNANIFPELTDCGLACIGSRIVVDPDLEACPMTSFVSPEDEIHDPEPGYSSLEDDGYCGCDEDDCSICGSPDSGYDDAGVYSSDDDYDYEDDLVFDYL